MAENIDDLPFDELIRHLNNGYYLDTFEVGSVKFDPIPWPTTTRKPKQQKIDTILDGILNRPWINPSKFTGSGFKKTPANDEGLVKKKLGSDLPPIRKTNTMNSAQNHTQKIDTIIDGILNRPWIDPSKFTGSGFKKAPANDEGLVKKKLGSDLPPIRKTNTMNSAQNHTQKIDTIIDGILKRPWIDPSKFNGSCFKIAPANDEGLVKKKLVSDSPSIRKTNTMNSAQNQTQSVSKKEEGDKLSCKMKKVVIKFKSSVLNCPKNLDNEEKEKEKKLEGAKRKPREQYEQIENEKKKRSVQIIDFAKPQPPSQVIKFKASVSNCPKKLEKEEEEKKLEGTKRKMREHYEQIENEKKKRRVQIIDFVKPQPPSPVKKKQQRKKPVQMIKSARRLPPLRISNSVC